MARQRKPLFQRVDRPRNVNRVVPIVKIRATDVIVFCCLSERPWGFSTHWTKAKRTQPCIAHRAACQHCAELCPRRDRGYVLAMSRGLEVIGFVDLTPQAFEYLADLAQTIGSLRGRWFVVDRERQQAKGALRIGIAGQHPDAPADLPADVDPEPSLRRIWGLDQG